MARPRTPTAILELKGAFKKDPQRAKARGLEPKPSGPLGDCPEHFTAEQLAAWDELTAQAPAGVLTIADRWLVESACRLKVRQLREDDPNCQSCSGKGFVSSDKNIMRCPRCAGLSTGEQAQLIKCLCLMGLTPVDRSKISVTKTKEQESPFAKIAAKVHGQVVN